jgi:hypothetical protein
VKREDLPSSEALASIGLAAAGAVAGLVARALVLGSKVVAVGLETLEHVIAGDRPSGSSSATVTDLRERRDERAAEDIEAAPWADGVDALPTEPDFAAFEPADGLTSTTTRPAPRRSSARTAARPRPAKRATGRSVPPSLRPVRGGPATPDAEPSGATTEPVTGAAAAADQPTATKTTAAKTTAAKTTAGKTTAAKKSAKTTAAKKSATKKTATKKTAATKASASPTPPAAAETPPPAPAEPAAAPAATPPATPDTTSSTSPDTTSSTSPDTTSSTPPDTTSSTSPATTSPDVDPTASPSSSAS